MTWRIVWLDAELNLHHGNWTKDFDLLTSWVRYVNSRYHLPHYIQELS